MTTGQLVVILLRLVVPLIILRRPLTGGVIAMVLDGLDVVIVEWISGGGMGSDYDSIDKWLDTYYLTLEAWVAWTWTARLPRLVALGLFAWRLVGVVLFEFVDATWLLFVFPNLFEHWYLFVLIVWRWFPGVKLDSWKQVAPWLVLLAVPKLAQEYLLHVADAQPWDWFKRQTGL